MILLLLASLIKVKAVCHSALRYSSSLYYFVAVATTLALSHTRTSTTHTQKKYKHHIYNNSLVHLHITSISLSPPFYMKQGALPAGRCPNLMPNACSAKSILHEPLKPYFILHMDNYPMNKHLALASRKNCAFNEK